MKWAIESVPVIDVVPKIVTIHRHRAASGVHGLGSLAQWDHGFESARIRMCVHVSCVIGTGLKMLRSTV